MIKGIHHITAISGDPQKNFDFYNEFLGLRFVKKTVNFDDPYTYHFYFGNESGDPGTIITFFPWGDNSLKGKRGNGQVTTISYSVPSKGKEFWTERFRSRSIEFFGPFSRFGDDVILFEDQDGIENELCFNDNDIRPGWNNGSIPEEFSIRGFYGAALSVFNREATEHLLTSVMGFKKDDETANRFRYKSSDNLPGTHIDIMVNTESTLGRMGVGAVHHIAFRVENDELQLQLRNKLNAAGLNATPVIDRMYFKSVYFREPGNILFEIATDPPGFLIDESLDNLGTSLKLPEWYEKIRGNIESKLYPIKIPEVNKK